MVKYTKLYFQSAHCQFMQRIRCDRAGSLGAKARYAVDRSSGRATETTATTTSPALKRLTRVNGNGPSRPSPSCSKDTYINSPPTSPSPSANVPVAALDTGLYGLLRVIQMLRRA
ncbi:hypothetical protein FIBSPDRAFT_585163 [Athelia psychrophila]|uniref:Uncharacterized protein n=1 Tax=Athelia psychrophila TaxID=1759441 RepID=A0A166HGV5_9AGAM|nr:hypothetical protein FIBSPDRAFT_585163 [Fibularhizoctonia sp. CBS 109695]